jgi:LysM repeat protein
MNRILIRKHTYAARLVSVIFWVILLTAGAVQAQSTSTRSQIAELSQRFTDLEQKYNLLKLEVENLGAENNRLKQELALIKTSSPGKDIESIIDAKLDAYRKTTEQYVLEQHEKILTLLSNRIGNVSQANVASLATPQTVTTTQSLSFSNDFPKNGELYVVQSGDTLSRIATKFGSTVKYIQDANKISDPNTVLIGQKLFIPFEKK